MQACEECGASLARDQKYCVTCGARRGDLPSRIAGLIGALDMPRPPLLAGVPPLTTAPPTTAAQGGFLNGVDDWIENAELPPPRVAALAVIGLLAFGVVMGSLVGAVSPTSPVYVMGAPAQPAAAVAEAAAEPVVAAAEAAGEAAAAGPSEPTGATTATGAVKVNHVWLIVLSGRGYHESFGDSQSQAYLTADLAAKGGVLHNYYAVAQGELANSIALISGQGPTWQTLRNCPANTDLTPGTIDAASAQALGDGCVYPETVRTLSDAVTATGKSAYAYVEDIDNGANGRASACHRPAAGEADPDHTTDASNAYASWSNPFAYFKSFIASANCQFQLGGLSALDADLAAGRSPAFSLIVPNRCHGGSDRACAPGAATGLTTSDEFLRNVVPKIMGSKDYLDGGVIAITFDNAPQGVAGADVEGCCGQPDFPNLATQPAATPPTPLPGPVTAAAGATGETGSTGQSGPAGPTGPTGEPQAPAFVPKTANGDPAGGGRVGLLLLSPYVRPGGGDAVQEYNHFSLLLSIENWLGTEKLGYTAGTNVSPLADSLLSAPAAN